METDIERYGKILLKKKKLSFNSIISFQRRHSSGSVSALASFDTHQKPSLDTKICQSIENYTTYSWIHRLALMVIAYRSTGEETNPLRQIFMSYDVDNSGTVEVDELRQAFILHDKYSKDDIDNIFLALVSPPFLLYTSVSRGPFYIPFPECFKLHLVLTILPMHRLKGYEWLRKDIMD